ncbi:MAG TPA: winged helix DNA-binding domain-containing protein [Candidatus Limnocylindrales bacterium]|nr:winged helix DNA-binding domain-containing protein [Candidatus Limnocylindrales bacterium]
MRDDVLSLRRLNRTLLARQLLLERSAMTPLDAVEHLVGLQAQLPTSPYLALRARIRDFEAGALEALFDARAVVRMVQMRATIHLVSTDDALAIRPVIQPVLDRELFANRTWAGGIEGVDLGPVLAAGRALVEERPRSLAELREALATGGFGVDPASLAYAVRNRLPTFQVPPRGLWTRSGDVRLTTLDTWAGRPMGTDTDPAPLLRRYLAAFGPASVADMQAWSRLTGLRAVVEAMRPELRTFLDERGRELFDRPDAPLATGDEPAPVRFLPDYDNALLSHADRTRIVPPLEWPERGDNVTAPVFLVDGFVAGTWRLHSAQRTRDAGELRLHAMTPLTATQRDEVEAEAASLAAFLATALPDRPAATVRWADTP